MTDARHWSSTDGRHEIWRGDCVALLSSLKDSSVDAVVTDPPYHLTQASRGGSPRQNNPATPIGRTRLGGKGFMGRTWDGGDVAFRQETWAAVLRVLKPGGNLLAFGGSRTWHRLCCAIEDAGFVIRDTLMWLYAQGMPKSLAIGKAVDAEQGLTREMGEKRCCADGTAPRPMRSRGFVRPWMEDPASLDRNSRSSVPATDIGAAFDGYGTNLKPAFEPIVWAMKPTCGTFAANAIEHGVAGLNIEACRIPVDAQADARDVGRVINRGQCKTQDGWGMNRSAGDTPEVVQASGRYPPNVMLDGAAAEILDDQSRVRQGGSGASRFFFVSKAKSHRRRGGDFNHHPTVKPVDLMTWLVRLAAPPGDPLIIDPFAGSGTTGVACATLGLRSLLIDDDADGGVQIAVRRMAAATHQPSLPRGRGNVCQP